MFTGIIECMGKVEKMEAEGGNINLTFSSPISDALRIDQSVAHDGVCLTVVDLRKGTHTVTAIAETLSRTNLSALSTGAVVNLERCLAANGRFDGHIVQGHVDTTAVCTSIEKPLGSTVLRFQHPVRKDYVTVEKGSVTVNGVSLTVVDATENAFSVHVIPFTLEHTNLSAVRVGSRVNIEFDILGKYVSRLLGRG